MSVGIAVKILMLYKKVLSIEAPLRPGHQFRISSEQLCAQSRFACGSSSCVVIFISISQVDKPMEESEYNLHRK